MRGLPMIPYPDNRGQKQGVCIYDSYTQYRLNNRGQMQGYLFPIIARGRGGKCSLCMRCAFKITTVWWSIGPPFRSVIFWPRKLNRKIFFSLEQNLETRLSLSLTIFISWQSSRRYFWEKKISICSKNVSSLRRYEELFQTSRFCGAIFFSSKFSLPESLTAAR